MTKPTMEPFASLAALKAAHADLLRRQREARNAPDLLAEVEQAIRRGAVTGVLLDTEDERWQAQNILDYWSTRLYRPDYEPPDATLAEFDPALAPALDDALCPYLGLDAFGEARSEVFFGRERLIAELQAKLAAERLLAVLGPSGSGKSSAVRAGLLPALRRGALPNSQTWAYLPIIVPGPQPLFSLGRLLGAQRPADEAEAFRANPRRLAEQIARQHDRPVVAVVDQFEEVFTLCTDDEARRAFVSNLLALVDEPARAHRVVITMRTDFEALISRLPEFQARFERATVRVTPLSAAELREAITRPAERVGLKFEDGVVDALLQDILGEPAALPLLQFTLLELWERRDRNRVTWEAYRELGGGRQALAHVADDFYNDLIPEEQTTARRLLLRLVRPGEGTEVTSNRVRRASLYQNADAADRVDRVLEKLIDAHLVRLTGAGPDAQVEVAHEALVRNWPTLVNWLDDERVTLRQRHRLTTAAEQWLRLNRDPNALWRGLLLEEAGRYDDLSELEVEFVRAGRAAAEAAEAAHRAAEEQAREAETARQIAEVEKRRAADQARAALRNRRLFQVAAVGFLIALGLGVLAGFLGSQASQNAARAQSANTQSALSLQNAQTQEAAAVTAQAAALAAQDQAVAQAATADFNRLQAEAAQRAAEAAQRESRARLLAAQGLAVSDQDPLLGLGLTLEALALIPAEAPQVRASFADAVRGRLAGGRIANLGADIHQLYASPSADLLIVDRLDQPAEARDTATGQLRYPLTADLAEAAAVGFSPDEAAWVAVYADYSGELRRSADGQVLAAFPAGLTQVEFSPDPAAALISVRYPAAGRGTLDTLQLFRVADGAPLAAEKTIVSLNFSEGAADYFAVRYADGTAEVRRTADGQVVSAVSGAVDEVVFSRDPAVTYFAVLYRDGRTELRLTARPVSAIRPLTGSIQRIQFPDREARYVLVTFNDGSSELRQLADEAVVFRLTDRVREVVYSPNGTYFGIVYFSGQAELRRLSTRRVVAQFTTDKYEFLEFPDPGETYVLLYNEFGRQELRRTSNGSLVTLEAVDSPADTADQPVADYYGYTITFSPDPEARYFAVQYGANAAELRRTDTGAVQVLEAPARAITFGNDVSGDYAVVTYADAPSALYRLSDLTRLATFNGPTDPGVPLNFSPDSAAAYFAVTYATAQAELWTTAGQPHRLAALGLAAFEQWFDLTSQRLVVRYSDNRVYLFDLTLLAELDGQPEALTPEALARLGCAVLDRHGFDAARLSDYLDGAPARACN